MLKLGADPEVFAVIDNNSVISPALMNKFCGAEFISVDPYLKHPTFIEDKDFKWIQDGVAYELTLKKPFEDSKEMFNTIQDSLASLEEFLSKFRFEDKEISLVKKPVVNINPKRYLKLIDDPLIHQGFIFGCDRDYDAINPDYICKTMNVKTHKFRYGGGHIHVSGDEILYEEIIPAIKLMAITVGNYSIANSKFLEEEKIRGTTYGRPGRYRPQNYPNGDRGLEYRSPSNSWLNYNQEEFNGIFYWTEKMYDMLKFNKEKGYNAINDLLDISVHSINTADSQVCGEILKELL
jgi:hypothetical protein